MAILYQQNFDALTAGAAVSGWSDIAGTWHITTANPVSTPNAFGPTATTDGTITLYTAMTAQTDMAAQVDFVAVVAGSASNTITPMVRMSTDGQNGYLATVDQVGNVQLFKRVTGTFTAIGSATAFGALTNGSKYTFKLEVLGTTLRFKLWAQGSAEPGSWTASVTDSSVSAAGVAGLRATVSASPAAASIDNFYIGDAGTTFTTGGALSIGAVTLGAVTPTGATASVGAASGGTGPYTYQWYASTTAGFTPASGTAISGATGTTLAAYNATTVGRYLKCVVTDAASVTATTTQMFVALPQAAYVIGFIGDSITQEKPTDTPFAIGGSVPTNGPEAACDVMVRSVNSQYGLRAAIALNQGVSGTATSDWTSTAGGSNYATAKAAFQAAGVTYISLMLGTNDARTPNSYNQATYQANLSTIVTTLVADFPSAKIILHAPPYPGVITFNGVTWSEASAGLCQAYQVAIAAVVAAHPGVVCQGDTTAFTYFAMHQGEINPDLIHPLRQGVETLGGLWAKAFAANVLGLGSTGSSSYVSQSLRRGR